MTTLAAELLVRALVVDHPATGAHPLDLARPHAADIAETVLVGLAAFQQQGQGLDARMRMRRRALGLARPNVDRAELVEEDERADRLVGVGRNGPAHFEPVAFEGPERVMDGNELALVLLFMAASLAVTAM